MHCLQLQVANNRGTQVTGGDDRNVELSLDPAKIELISLTDPASCIRTLITVRGGLAIIDDGSIPNLAALSRVRSIVGPLFIYGRANASLTSLAGLEALQVGRSSWAKGFMRVWHCKLQCVAAHRLSLAAAATAAVLHVMRYCSNLPSAAALHSATKSGIALPIKVSCSLLHQPMFTKLVRNTHCFRLGLPNRLCVCLLLPSRHLQQVGGLNIAHTRIQNIAALSKLTVLQGDLVAWDNPALTSLSGVQGVTHMYGKLWLDENPLLQDLNGLQVCRAVCCSQACGCAHSSAARALAIISQIFGVHRQQPHKTQLSRIDVCIARGSAFPRVTNRQAQLSVMLSSVLAGRPSH
jgi:hypothetical protein